MGFGGEHDFTCDLGGKCLREHGTVTKAPQIQLETLALDTELIGRIFDHEMREVGLFGDGTHARELVGGEAYGGDVGWRGEDLDMINGVANGATQHGEFARHGEFHGHKGYGGAMASVLSPAQIDQYQRDGFLVIADFSSVAACSALRARANDIVDAFAPTERRTIFSTNEQDRISNGEFLASGNGTWCFFEEEAFAADGSLRQDKSLSINKIGHAVHDLDPVFESFSYTPELAAVATDIGLTDALALQSMYIFKQPHIGGEVGCHQDATFLYTDPMTVTGFWFAIEDSTLENGCLWALPGGHRTSLRKVFKRAGSTDDDGTLFEVLDASPLPDVSNLVPLEVAAGSLVVLHGLLPHWSDVNRSAKSRHAFSLHCISAAANYPTWNWLQRAPDFALRRLDRSDRVSA